MRLYILCFAAGVSWLQVQAQLPVPRAHWLAPPLALLALIAWAPRPLLLRVTRRSLAALGCGLCGFVWAAWLAQHRLADALPAEWEGRDIQLSGVVATMPQPYERSGGVSLDVKDRYLAQTLLDLSQTATMDHSLRLGRVVLRELGQVNTLHKPRVEQASFAVLKAPDVPSILVETAFISNPDEEKRLNDQAYQDRLARALLAGIKQYIAKHPPRPHGPLAQAGGRAPLD